MRKFSTCSILIYLVLIGLLCAALIQYFLIRTSQIELSINPAYWKQWEIFVNKSNKKSYKIRAMNKDAGLWVLRSSLFTASTREKVDSGINDIREWINMMDRNHQIISGTPVTVERGNYEFTEVRRERWQEEFYKVIEERDDLHPRQSEKLDIPPQQFDR